MVKKVAFFTLGCKVNQNEAEALKELFRAKGYRTVPFQETADVYVIHTCTVTHLADRKSRQMLRRAAANNPEAVVVASGCYAQVAPEEIQGIEGVDLIVGTRQRARIVELAEEARAARSISLVEEIQPGEVFEELPTPATSRTRAFLKVQEGCRQFCTYCIVPFARGPVRSRPPENAIWEARRLVEAGYREIVLSGIHLGSYGVDLPGGVNLNSLLRMLAKVPGLDRLRISSLDPHEFTEELLETIGAERIICPHFHIPLQSGDDRILKLMGRSYSAEDYLKLTERLRQVVSRPALTTDVIVGFPGETTANYQNTRQLVESVSFSGLHVFKYSPRKGTPAAEYPNQVAPGEKDVRSKDLIALGRELQKIYAEQFAGEVKEVLVEKVEQGIAEGHTDNYLLVHFPAEEEAAGSMVSVRLGHYQTGCLQGRAVERKIIP